MAIGIEVRIYERDWARRFTWLATGLDRLDHTQKRSLQSWLRSGINLAAGEVPGGNNEPAAVPERDITKAQPRPSGPERPRSP